ncbi:hypothetical protein [Porphyromonas gingivalis]|uniref:hypothetical protein n=1 Tax=Porphyromonas gingivalis TaxID=837 RepID=UPI000B4E5B0A|nr:hypothetical protein [Porphyromonas gingivalis]OWR77429.1 hypothetical protein SJDPG11_07745 [Porphyromonas gingivalis SJD11]
MNYSITLRSVMWFLTVPICILLCFSCSTRSTKSINISSELDKVEIALDSKYSVIAKYTDEERASMYYCEESPGKLYRFDAKTKETVWVPFFVTDDGEPMHAYSIKYATPSKDGKSIIIITNTGNNFPSVTEAIYKLNTYTQEMKEITMAAEIQPTLNGYSIRLLRLTKMGTATYENEYEDEYTYLDGNGDYKSGYPLN